MPEPLALDDRQLLVELQSLGVRVVDETAGTMPGRRGGAGPSDAMFLWVRGLPLTVPSHAAFVDASPYVIKVAGRRATLYRDGELVVPGDAAAAAEDLRHGDRGRGPVLEDRAAAPGLDRVHGRAEVHLLGHAGAVRVLRDRADARRADGVGQDAGDAGRGLHGGARLRPRGRRDADHGLAEPARPRRDLHLALRARDQGGVRAPDPGPVRAAGRSPGARGGVAGPASTRSASTPRRSTRRCSRASRRARRSAASRATSAPGRRPSTCSGPGRVTTYVLLGMGEREELIVEGCRRAIAMGVYPFVVPLRPVPGTLMADVPPPPPDYVARIYAEVSAMLADAGFDHMDAKAGLRALPGVLGAVGVGAGAPARRRRRCPRRSRRRASLARGLAASAGRARGALRRAPGGLRRAAAAVRGRPRRARRRRAARGRRRRRCRDRRGAALPARPVRSGRATGWRCCPGHRAGAELVNFAVRTAGERGGTRMVAQVQVANVRFFERLGWVRDGEPALYRGVMHQPMAIAL